MDRLPGFSLDSAPKEFSALAHLLHLMQDSGKLINLYDLFQVFSASDQKSPEELDSNEELDQALVAPFIAAIAGLAWQGLVSKSGSRKPDHIVKTFFH